jgi:hypothetical protein
VSLGFIALVLTASIWLSMRKDAREEVAAAHAVGAGSGDDHETDGNSADRNAAGPDTPAQATPKHGGPS